jgi:predicted metal-binding protein
MEKETIESIIKKHGFSEFRWINPKEIVVSHWVRVKCTFGCPDYGQGACPPNTPSVDDCSRFFNEYNNGIILKINKFADREAYPSEWSLDTTNRLLELERQVFLNGYQKAFLLNQTCCSLCSNCRGNRVECVDKSKSRPSPEGFAIDVYQTVRNAGLDIHVISKNPSEISRIAILLID